MVQYRFAAGILPFREDVRVRCRAPQQAGVQGKVL
jgi:hypothetical protein